MASLIPFLAGDLPAVQARAAPALAELRARVAIEPDNAKIWGFIAGLELLLGRPEEALLADPKNDAPLF